MELLINDKDDNVQDTTERLLYFFAIYAIFWEGKEHIYGQDWGRPLLRSKSGHLAQRQYGQCLPSIFLMQSAS